MNINQFTDRFSGSSLRWSFTLLFFFFSGMGGLIYQVLWMNELGLLFGSTAYATATTLAAFFSGIAGGSYFFGRQSSSIKRPLRLYAVPASVENVLWHYAGNLTSAPALVSQGLINTDDKPVIEYIAPVSNRSRKAKMATAFIQQELIDFYEVLFRGDTGTARTLPGQR